MTSGWTSGGRRRSFAVLVAIGAVVCAQSFGHLALVLGSHRVNTVFDLDRSNGLPDLVSTLALAAAAGGAMALAHRLDGRRRTSTAGLAVTLGALTVADVLHSGAHPSGAAGWLVIALAIAATALIAVCATTFTGRARATIVVAAALLAASFLTNGLDRFDQWFERERGDPIREYQIVAKEGLELVGWSLVALALWDEALRGKRRESATARASRAPAPPTRHVV